MLVAIVWFCSDRDISAGLVAWPLLVVTVLLGTLMVSRVRYWSFKAGMRSGRVPFAWIFLLLVLLVLLAIDLPAVLLTVGALYVLSGPVLTVYGRSRHRSRRRGPAGGQAPCSPQPGTAAPDW